MIRVLDGLRFGVVLVVWSVAPTRSSASDLIAEADVPAAFDSASLDSRNAADAVAIDRPIILPTGIAIPISIDDALSSKTSKQGDRFAFHVSSDVMVDENIVIPRGTAGYGEVIHADNAGMGGKPGELILSARILEWGDRQIALRRFRFGLPETLSGVDRSATATTMGIAGTVIPGLSIGSLFVKGGEFVVPKGTLAHALTSEFSRIDPLVQVQTFASADAPTEIEDHNGEQE